MPMCMVCSSRGVQPSCLASSDVQYESVDPRSMKMRAWHQAPLEGFSTITYAVSIKMGPDPTGRATVFTFTEPPDQPDLKQILGECFPVPHLHKLPRRQSRTP